MNKAISNIHQMYNKMGSNLEETLNSEIVSVSYSCKSKNFLTFIQESRDLFNYLANDVLLRRKEIEIHLHESMKHQMLTRLLEMKFYSEVNIFDTRRLLAVSSDCISTIQILIRDKIYLNCYLRSSDYLGALPVDLEKISELPKALIEHIEYYSDLLEYSECTEEKIQELKNKEIELTLSFGSLHIIDLGNQKENL